MKVAIGIDPSSTILGFSAIDVEAMELLKYKTLRLDDILLHERFYQVVNYIASFVDDNPGDYLICLEKPAPFGNGKKFRMDSLIVMERCIKQWADKQKIEIREYYPTQWQNGLLGSKAGNRKGQAKAHAQDVFGPFVSTEHVYDATCIALYGIMSSEREER